MPMAKLLKDRTAYYFFVSSIAVYKDYATVGMDETAPTRLERPGYGGNKARSEKTLLEMFGDRVGIARPSAIMGPGDESLSYNYWLSRLAKDHEIVAPGSGTDAFAQYVDVRDVASWMIDCVERVRGGVFNVHSGPAQFRVFLEQSSKGIGGKAKPVWVDGDFLRNEQHIRPFDHLPSGLPIARASNKSRAQRRTPPAGWSAPWPRPRKTRGPGIRKPSRRIWFTRRSNTVSSGASPSIASAKSSPPGN